VIDTVVLACALVSFWKAGALAEAIGFGGDRLFQLEIVKNSLGDFCPPLINGGQIAALFDFEELGLRNRGVLYVEYNEVAVSNHPGAVAVGDRSWKVVNFHLVGFLSPIDRWGANSSPF
jgi:hypothetical protein